MSQNALGKELVTASTDQAEPFARLCYRVVASIDAIPFSLVHAWEAGHHPINSRGCHLEIEAIFQGQELDYHVEEFGGQELQVRGAKLIIISEGNTSERLAYPLTSFFLLRGAIASSVDEYA